MPVHDLRTLARRASEAPRWRVGLGCWLITHAHSGCRYLDPRAALVRFQHGVGHDLRVVSVKKTRNSRTILDDGRDELPLQVIAEDRSRGALRRVTRAAGG